MLITGAVLEYRNFQGPNGVAFAVALMIPGVVVLVITQVMWSRFRVEHGLVVRRPDPPEDPPDTLDSGENTETREMRVRRRSQRRRSSRSGRSSR